MRSFKNIKRIFLSWTALLLGITVLFFWYSERNIRPMLKSVIINASQTYATNCINNAVIETLSKINTEEKDIIHITYDNENNVKAINCDYIKMNKLKANITNAVQEKISVDSDVEMTVPLGMFSGLEVFKNTGPAIPIKTKITGGVTTDFKTSLKESGINQSLYTVSAEINADISVYSSVLDADSSVKTSFIIAQAFISGSVPNISLNGKT